MADIGLNEREEAVLEAVIRTYIETAEPAGSRTVAKRHGLGVSPATIRNAMADLEEKGYLYHPHTSAGRIPTDLAYRYYVDTMMRPVRISAAEQRRLRRELGDDEAPGGLERLIRRAAQALGLLTGDLGVAIAPRLDQVVLEKLELVLVSSDKVLLVLTLRNGIVRTVYVDVPARVPAEALASVTMILNERLAGLSLSEIRASLPERLRDATDDPHSHELLNIFMQSANELMVPLQGEEQVVLGRASVLANQPEFAGGTQLKNLIELTEQRELLRTVLSGRAHDSSPTITIGAENRHPRLSSLTLVTSEYRFGNVSGVLGVMGPTRMAYEKVAAIVEYTSLLMGELAAPPRSERGRDGSQRAATA
jgi:heat-inducible transcriptional repressor